MALYAEAPDTGKAAIRRSHSPYIFLSHFPFSLVSFFRARYRVIAGGRFVFPFDTFAREALARRLARQITKQWSGMDGPLLLY